MCIFQHPIHPLTSSCHHSAEDRCENVLQVGYTFEIELYQTVTQQRNLI